MTTPERMSNEPTVAVVVPAKDEERFLRPCLRSIREQWFKALECVIVDDGSTDGTLEIAQEFADKDERFRVVRHAASQGLAAARNSGVSSTTAPYLTFLDADDFLYQHSLRRRLEVLQETTDGHVAGAYCDWQTTREKQGREEPKRSAGNKPEVVGFSHGPECPFIATSPMIRRDVLVELGGFDNSLPTAEDFDLWVRVMRAGYTFRYVPMIGVAYRQKSTGMVFTETARHARISADILARQYEDLTGQPQAPYLAQSLAHYQLECTRAHRLLRSFALAAAAGQDDDVLELASLIPIELTPLIRAGLDVRGALLKGLGRAARSFSAISDQEARERLADELEERLFSRRDPGSS